MPPKKEARALQYVEIDDFTPGIIRNSNLAYPNGGGNGPVPGKQPGQAQNAVGCIALPNGGLAPLPGLTDPSWNTGAYPIPPLHTPLTESVPTNMINGFFVQGPIRTTGGEGDEILVSQTGSTSVSASLVWYLDSIHVANQPGNPPFYATAGVFYQTGGTIALPFVTMTGGQTRAGSDPDVPNPACWALGAWYLDTDTTYSPIPGNPYVFLYPDPTTSTPSYTPYELSVSIAAQVLCHQNRVVLLQWARQNYSGTATYFESNESFNYTDPPNGIALGGADEVFVQEDPQGYGAWGSISASELFLVKHNTGGVVIQGDLNAPTVTRLPGVTPTKGITSRAGASPIGLIYAVNNRGLWLWNGSNTSQKISEQLEDTFFEVPGVTPGLVYNGPTVDIVPWGDWVIVSNDWLFDTNLGGWWKLPLYTDNLAHLWYGVSWDGSTLYACAGIPTATHMLDVYDRATPSTTYTWTSYPMRPANEVKNRSLSVQEVVVRAQGYGTIEVTLTGVQGSAPTGYSPSQTLTFELGADENQPRMQRITTGLNAQDVIVEITSTGGSSTTPAPILYSIAVGWQDDAALVSSG